MVWTNHWNQGLDITDFLASMTARHDEYIESIASFEPDAGIVESVSKWQSGIRVGIITEDWCGDAANYLPAFLKLFSNAPDVEVRIFRRDENPEVRDANLIGGKAKIPVVVALDAEFKELARFVERPAAVNRWLVENLGGKRWNDLSEDERAHWKPIFLAKGREFRADAVKHFVEAVNKAILNTAGA